MTDAEKKKVLEFVRDNPEILQSLQAIGFAVVASTVLRTLRDSIDEMQRTIVDIDGVVTVKQTK